MGAKMKLLFEGWRKYISEAEESPEEILRHRFDQEAYDQLPKEQWAINFDEAEKLIEKYSLNSAKGSQHRWGRGRPIVDYDLDLDGDEIVYSATIQIAPVKISERSFEAEGDLEGKVRGIIEKARLEEFDEAKLSSINIMTEPYSAIHIYYMPVTPPWQRSYQRTPAHAPSRSEWRKLEKAQAAWDPMENLELFLKRVNYIADELEKIKIVEKITAWLADPYNEPSDAYLQQKLPLPEV